MDKNFNKCQPDFYDNYDKDVSELERNLYLDKIRSDQYKDEIIRNIKQFDKHYIVKNGTPKRYKIPMKIRFKNFMNKLVNTFK